MRSDSNSRPMARVFAWIFVAGALSAAPATAQNYQRAGGYAIYLGVVPAEVVRGHPPEHPERKMHDGSPAARGQHHVVISVFDAGSGARIEDAVVRAAVGEPGLTPVERKLEPMTIAGTMSYGGYFSMRAQGPYRIEVTVARPGVPAVNATFAYSHPR